LFLAEDVGHDPGIILRPRAPMGHFVAPQVGLAIEVFQGGEGASGEEGFSYETNHSFYATFLIPTSRTTGMGREVIMRREF
jgi:hypothetical protein